MANFEVVQGSRKGSKIYIHENFQYSVLKTYQTHVRLRCAHYKKFMCGSSAVIKEGVLTLIKAHNHRDDQLEIAVQGLKNQLKKAVAEGTGIVKDIYEEVLTKYEDQVKDKVKWNNMKSML